MLKTVLNTWHIAHGASMTDFNGWHMPLMYLGMSEEHLHTRNAAGIFDLGHMGRLVVYGAGTYDFIDSMTPAQLSTAKPGDVLYSFILKEDGCPIDDITIYYDNPEWIMLVVNASNREAVMAWLTPRAAAAGVKLDDMTFEWAMIALQGPTHEPIMTATLGEQFHSCPYYTFYRLPESNMIVSATGYTGESGYEIYAPQDCIAQLWQTMVDAGAMPIGLGARDTLRLEAAMPLFGHELNGETTPLEAMLGRFIDWDKKDFVGRTALLKMREAGVQRKLIGYELLAPRGPIARHGMAVTDPDGNSIGHVASGCLSPSLHKIIGMAYVQSDYAAAGTKICLDIRGRKHEATVVKKPFYRRKK